MSTHTIPTDEGHRFDAGDPVWVRAPSLPSVDGKRGHVQRRTWLNADNRPGYIVNVDGHEWTLYAEEVTP